MPFVCSNGLFCAQFIAATCSLLSHGLLPEPSTVPGNADCSQGRPLPRKTKAVIRAAALVQHQHTLGLASP